MDKLYANYLPPLLVVNHRLIIEYVSPKLRAELFLGKEGIIGDPIHNYFPKNLCHRIQVGLLKVPEGAFEFKGELNGRNRSISIEHMDENQWTIQIEELKEDFVHPAWNRYNNPQIFQAIFDQTAFGFLLVNSAGEILISNGTFAQLLGYNKGELVGMKFRDLSHPADLELTNEQLQPIWEGTSNWAMYEKRYLRKDGSVFWANVGATSIENNGEIFYLGVIQDITDRRITENALKISQERYKLILEHAFDALILSDIRTNTAIECNQRALDLFGYEKEEFFKKTILEVSPPFQENGMSSPAYLEYLVNEAKKGDGSLRYQWIHLKKDGTPFYTEAQSFPLSGENKYQFVTILKDLTYQRETQSTLESKMDELNATNEELRRYIESNLALENFAYITSHDLREPLRTVTSFTQMLQRRYSDQFDEVAQTYMGYIVDATKNMNDLVEDLLVYSRVNNDSYTFTSFSLETLIRKVTVDIQVSIKEHQARVQMHQNMQLVGNFNTLYQVFLNLINNAIKFKKEDQHPDIHVFCQENDRFWQFTVQDNGIGVHPDFHDKIFLLFKRLHPKKQYKGTGLGLAIVKKIIEKHGGRIWVESAEGQGAKFHFTIEKRQKEEVVKS